MCQTEALSRRVKDLDFSQHQIIIRRNAKGMKDRITMLPDSPIFGPKTTLIYTHVSITADMVSLVHLMHKPIAAFIQGLKSIETT